MCLEQLMGRRFTMTLEVFGESMEYVPCLDLSIEDVYVFIQPPEVADVF